ncbi:hypothetical protein [uncultured Microbacterium sp.]|nr:hypothetical protein [uncultured Microbacterium sp.]
MASTVSALEGTPGHGFTRTNVFVDRRVHPSRVVGYPRVTGHAAARDPQ